jgi:hypothetical protein
MLCYSRANILQCQRDLAQALLGLYQNGAIQSTDPPCPLPPIQNDDRRMHILTCFQSLCPSEQERWNVWDLGLGVAGIISTPDRSDCHIGEAGPLSEMTGYRALVRIEFTQSCILHSNLFAHVRQKSLPSESSGHKGHHRPTVLPLPPPNQTKTFIPPLIYPKADLLLALSSTLTSLFHLSLNAMTVHSASPLSLHFLRFHHPNSRK